MHRSVVVVTVKGVVTLPRILGRVIAGKLRFEVVYNSHFYNYSIYKSVIIVTVKVGVVTFPKILGRKVIAGKLSFEAVCGGHFYNYSIYRSIVVTTVKWVW